MSEYRRWRLNATLQLGLYNCPDQSEAALWRILLEDILFLKAEMSLNSEPCPNGFLLSWAWDPGSHKGILALGEVELFQLFWIPASNDLTISPPMNTSEFLDKASPTYPWRKLVNSLSNDYMHCIHQIFPWSTLSKNYTNESKMNNWKRYFAFLKNCPEVYQ